MSHEVAVPPSVRVPSREDSPDQAAPRPERRALIAAGLVGLLGLSALDRLGRLAVVGGAQITVYQLAVAAVFALLSWAVVTGRVRLRRLVFAPWATLLLLGAAATTPGALSVRTGIVQFLSLTSAIGLGCLVGWLCGTPGRTGAAVTALLGMGSFLAVMALLEAAGVYSVQAEPVLWEAVVRARVTLHDPNTLGGLLAAAAAAGVPLALSGERRAKTLGLWAGVATCAAGVVATQSRGALSGLVVAVALCGALSPVSRRAKSALAVAFLVGMAGALAALGPEWITQRVVNVAVDPNLTNRVDLVERGLQLFARSPFGIGPGNWLLVFDRTFGRVVGGATESHMTWITVLVECGVPGLLGLVGAGVAAVGMALRGTSSKRTPETLAAVAGALVLLVQSVTYSMETSKPLWFFIGLCAASVTADRMRSRAEGDAAPKVCMVQYNSSRAFARVHRAAVALSGAGAEVVLIAIKDDSTESFEQRDGYVVKRVELVSRRWPTWTRPVRWLEAVARTWIAAVRERADAYDARDIYPLFVTWRAARVNDALFVYDSDELNLYRNWPWTASKWWRILARAYEGFFVRRVDSLMTTDPGRAAILARLYGMEAVVVRNVAELVVRVEPDASFRECALKGRSRLLLYTGGLIPNRGLEALIDALEMLPDHALAIVGTGHLEGALRRRIVDRGLQDRAEVYPAVTLAELMRMTAAADALVAPIVGSCLSYVHAVPQKVYEAMMVGIPVVTSDLPDMADVVRAEEVGTLIADPLDPASIADAIRRLFALGEDDLVLMRARARAAALERYNWPLERELLIAEYRRIGLLPPEGGRT
jgi:glycosyltransferase involved in cell wall biosynthesis